MNRRQEFFLSFLYLTDFTGNAKIKMYLRGGALLKRIKRKPKLEKREVTAEERERAIRQRATTYVRNEVVSAYLRNGNKEAWDTCRSLCSNGGFAGGGFWVSGTPKGIKVEVRPYPNYTNDNTIIAECLITYREVKDYIIKEYEEKVLTHDKKEEEKPAKSSGKKVFKRKKNPFRNRKQ